MVRWWLCARDDKASNSAEVKLESDAGLRLWERKNSAAVGGRGSESSGGAHQVERGRKGCGDAGKGHGLFAKNLCRL